MKRAYIDLNIHVRPDGEDEIELMVEKLSEFGFSGCVILNHSDMWYSSPDLEPPPGFSIYQGVEIRASSPRELVRLIGKFRPMVDLLAVHGGDEVIDRLALGDPRVDLLSHPGRMNHIMMRLGSKKGVALELNLFDIIHGRGKRRTRSLFMMRENVRLARKYRMQVVVTSGASSIYDIRAPREIISLSKLLGMNQEEAKDALSVTPRHLLDKRARGHRRGAISFETER
ncbi:MAG TPA: hypothetical protein ENG09_03430 [Candidatus Syntrophoarchaeum butanivorans]|uniref:Ribonuclease P protein component 3 n=1 Tax=Candidatus Syntropharchaeum butanivorans TaxID=1839936 RepID=A0A1F2P5Y1_9EURY|nr:MAG: ribonuclease P [Candidatus Syntrophoarchaeum butanivorans]RJS72424.1 MAG: hypothetical protein CW694_02940 [Candidatus Syntrophoarchaeum sp. WYZ-LMO15]HDM36291.1 hypothetical protein [Candidatus Syntrophoarchaeum butanivorans]HEC56805.1 hypothetical protein [Candidatus Syntrophoarchaeum butanivorans]